MIGETGYTLNYSKLYLQTLIEFGSPQLSFISIIFTIQFAAITVLEVAISINNHCFIS